MTAPYTQKCALWIPWTVMKGHETTFLHTARTPGSFFNDFMLHLSDTSRSGGVKSWPCLCEIDLNFTWLRGSWEKVSNRKLTILKIVRGSTDMSIKWDTNPCPSPCPSPPDSVPTWHREDLFDQNSEICWIEFPDTILNLFNWLKQKTPFTQNQIWTDFRDLYPFVQIAPDKTGQKFNKKSMPCTLVYSQLPVTTPKSIGVPATICYDPLRWDLFKTIVVIRVWMELPEF